MKDIMAYVSNILRDNVITALSKVGDALGKMFEYLEHTRLERSKKEAAKEEADTEKDVETACDSGTIGSLMDAVGRLKKARANRKLFLVAFVLVTVSGCTTIEIYTTKPWEGRYQNAAEASKALNGIMLDKKESVWLLSNQTLKRVLTTDKE